MEYAQPPSASSSRKEYDLSKILYWAANGTYYQYHFVRTYNGNDPISCSPRTEDIDQLTRMAEMSDQIIVESHELLTSLEMKFGAVKGVILVGLLTDKDKRWAVSRKEKNAWCHYLPVNYSSSAMMENILALCECGAPQSIVQRLTDQRVNGDFFYEIPSLARRSELKNNSQRGTRRYDT
jgi:hypothetical protein